MRVRGFYTLLFLGCFTALGCAADVDDPVDQIAEPAPAKDPPPVPFGGERRFYDPLMAELVKEANGDLTLPDKGMPYTLPLENCGGACWTR
jgi:hypothetical protein